MVKYFAVAYKAENIAVQSQDILVCFVFVNLRHF